MKSPIAGLVFAFGLAMSGAAQSGDMEVPTSTYDWTGGYVGLQVGYGWGDTQPIYNVTSQADVNMKGFLGGLDAGYNIQTGNIVLGLEVDASLVDISGSLQGSPNTPCVFSAPSVYCTANVNWLTTGRIRAGYAINNVMPYITGGLALGGVEGTFDFGGACNCFVDDKALGYVVGGGIEWAVTEKWTTKAEFLYVNLGTPSISGTNTFVEADTYDFATARFGFNYAF